MQSKTSFFNKYLYLKTLLRFWPLWVIVSIGGAITAYVSADITGFGRYSGRGLSAEVFGNEATGMFPVVSMIYAIVVAMCVWSYLYSKNSNYSFHSMPITRTGLFVTHYLAGLTMMIIPFVIAAGLQIAILAMVSTLAYREMFFAIAAAVVECFFFFSFATMTAFVTSNLMALPVLYMVFNFLQVGITGITNILRTGFYPGASASDYGTLSFLSPVVWIISNIDYRGTYIYNEEGHMYNITDSEIVNASYLWILVGVGIIFIALSLLAYRNKRSEDVGDVVSVKWLRPVLLVIFTYCAATCGAIVVWEFSRGFSTEDYFSIPVMGFLLSLFGLIAIYVGIMLLQGTTKIFNRKTVWVGVATVIFFITLSAVLGFDLFHTARYVPKAADVEKVVASFPGDKYVLNKNEHADIIERLIIVNEKMAEESQYIRTAERAYTNEQTMDYLNITYTLKSGRKINKKYSIPVTRARLNNPDTYDYALYNFVNTPECQLLTYCLTDEYKIFAATINCDNGFYYDVEENKLDGLVEAFRADIMAGNIKKNFFGEDDGYGVTVDMSFEELEEWDDDEWRNTWAYIVLNDRMTNLVNYLLGEGIIDESSLTEAPVYFKDMEY